MLIISLFLMGLSGGFGHCVAMCHPFVLLISAIRHETGYRILIPQLKYNIGRIITYSFLGFLIGQINLLPYKKYLITATGVLLIIIALLTAFGKNIPIPKGMTLRLNNTAKNASPLVMGIILGFLPCGMIVGALVAASAAPSAIISAASMAAFGLGTSVALLLLALFGGVITKYAPAARWVFLAIVMIMGVRFIYMGMKMMTAM